MRQKKGARVPAFGRRLLLGGDFLKAVLCREKKPLIVSWAVTNRCNLQCVYCDSPAQSGPELSTQQVLAIMADLYRRGTRVIRLTGGEPLLRDDLGAIIGLSQRLGMLISIATNGVLVPEKASQLKAVDQVIVSLDGSEGQHDRLRGAGSYKAAVEACRTLLRDRIPFSISTVVTAMNAGGVDHVLGLAAGFGAQAFFHPATSCRLFSESPNPAVLADSERIRIFGRLLELKRNRRPVGNSVAGLHYLTGRSGAQPVCLAGRIFFRIEPDGVMHACPRAGDRKNGPNLMNAGVDGCLKDIMSRACGACQSSTLLELNLMAGLDWRMLAEKLHNGH